MEAGVERRRVRMEIADAKSEEMMLLKLLEAAQSNLQQYPVEVKKSLSL